MKRSGFLTTLCVLRKCVWTFTKKLDMRFPKQNAINWVLGDFEDLSPRSRTALLISHR